MKKLLASLLGLWFAMTMFAQGGMGPGPGTAHSVGACTTPDCVAGGPALWLKADSLSLSDTDPVSTWEDSFGSNDATSVTTERPTFQTNEINSLPVVRFDGVNDWMQVADVAALEMDTDSTVFLVVNLTTGYAGPTAFIAKDSAAASAGAYFYYADNLGKLGVDRPFIEAGVVSTGGISLSTYYLVCAKVSSTTVSHYLDGTANGTDTLATGTATSQPLRIGAFSAGSLSGFNLMDVAEIIIYNSALSDGNRDIIEAYIAAKYALTIAQFDALKRLLYAA